jgi:hypothetical protein
LETRLLVSSILGNLGDKRTCAGMMGGMGGEERDSPPMLSVLRISGEARH